MKELLYHFTLTISIFFLSLFNNIFAQSKDLGSISGRVVDLKTGEALQYVSVFLANTMNGTGTDVNGEFLLQNIEKGSYELVITLIGFEMQKYKLHINGYINNLTFKLRRKVLEVPEIVIKGSNYKKWKKDLKLFKKLFLGEGKNRKKCKIINSDVLRFNRDKKKKLFTANAYELLLIENRALGYKLHSQIEYFEVVVDTLEFYTHLWLEELTPESTKEKKKWGKNRRETYYGSLRHFLSSLCIDQLYENGFYVYESKPDSESGNNNLNLMSELNDFVFQGEYDYERIIKFDNTLCIVYDEKILKLPFEKRRGEVLNKAIYYERYLNKYNKRSWIKLKTDSVRVHTTGYFIHPLQVSTSGEWLKDRIADWLPLEYSPLEN